MITASNTLKNIYWFSGYPAPYMREFQRELEKHIAVRFYFFPLGSSLSAQRAYEDGALPNNHIVVNAKAFLEIIRAVILCITKRDILPVFCGIYPRPLFFIQAVLVIARKKKAFLSDVNVLSAGLHRTLKSIPTGAVLSKRDIILYIGTLNHLYYRQHFSRKASNFRYVHFPYPHQPAAYACERTQKAGDPIRYLYLGRLAPVKNTLSILKAARILHTQSIAPFMLTIIGSGSDKQSLESYCHAHDMYAYVRIHESLPSSQSHLAYAEADIFVLASLHEPWGLVVNEALSAGMPVIAPVWAGAAFDLITDRYNGRLLKEVTPEAIAEAMQYYIQRPNELAIHSEKAVKAVVNNKKTNDECLQSLMSIMA